MSEFKNLLDHFKRNYKFAIGSILFLLILSALTLNFFLKGNSKDAKIINISGRQRMLSQKITKNVLLYKESNNKFLKDKILKDMDNFESSHLNLTGIGELNLSGLNTEKVNRIYKKMAPHYQQHLDWSSCLIDGACEKDLVEYSLNSEKFLALMNQIVFDYESISNNALNDVRYFLYLFSVLIFVALILEMKYIFQPMVEQIKRSFEDEFDRRKKRQEMSHMIEIGQSSALISHELKNMIAAIHMSAELIQRKGDEFSVGQAAQVLNAVGRTQKIIDLVRRLSKKEKSGYEELSFNDLFEDFNLFVKPKFQKSKAKLFIDHDGSQIKCNKVGIVQVFNNLVSNAIDATEYSYEKKIFIKAYSNEHTWKIEVSDTGNGVPKEIQPKLFQERFTTKVDSDGTGIGLNFCKQIIQMHGGSIRYEDNEKTTFVIEIPLYKNEIKEAS